MLFTIDSGVVLFVPTDGRQGIRDYLRVVP